MLQEGGEKCMLLNIGQRMCDNHSFGWELTLLSRALNLFPKTVIELLGLC